MNIIYSFSEIFENSAVERGETRLRYLPPSDCIIYAVSELEELSWQNYFGSGSSDGKKLLKNWGLC